MHTIIRILILCCLTSALCAQELSLNKTLEHYTVSIARDGKQLLSSPKEGLWSIATGWQNGWPSDWKHAQIMNVANIGEWKEATGKIVLPEGEWLLKDDYKKEGTKIKCIRRFEWNGKTTLGHVTLSVRWIVPSANAKPFLPGILYYGNPSGEKNGKNNVATYHENPGEEALFEEHRYPMPFSSVEWKNNNHYYGAALHSLPSPVYRGNHFDQWWSLGLKTNKENTELEMLSGPVTYNGKKNVVKALQDSGLTYGDTYTKVEPGTVIEKIFYLEAYPVAEKGSGFQTPVHTSIDLFKPFSTEGLPGYAEIIKLKYRFANSRWLESGSYAGFNMYPSYAKPQIVMGWCGQAGAPGYAMQVLADELNDKKVWNKVQSSMDHLCTAPIDEEGFCVIYDIKSGRWTEKDPVSQGQAMNNIALAIKEGRKNKKVNTKKWETFLKGSANVFAKRILDPTWKPRNTAEAFFISPLVISYQLFGNNQYKAAAIKAADYYAKRNLNMDEPYWGGTLDATCEDKEGAWGAFQGFLSVYELTHNTKYLKDAKHACDVVLSYAVVWDIPLPAGRLADHDFKTRGWTSVSVQNQHLDVYGIVMAPSIYKMGTLLQDASLQKLAKTMFVSCGQLTDATGSQGEQIQETNYAQQGEMNDVYKLRGGYSEDWTVFWITAHFLNAAAQFKEMGVHL